MKEARRTRANVENSGGIKPKVPEIAKTPLVLYRKERKFQMAPPVTRKIFWFWTPEQLSSLQARGALEEIGERLESFCGEKSKEVRATIFSGMKDEREESLIMVEVSGKLLGEQEREMLMRDVSEPPRRYPKKKE